jgi:hypothetical protein
VHTFDGVTVTVVAAQRSGTGRRDIPIINTVETIQPNLSLTGNQARSPSTTLKSSA